MAVGIPHALWLAARDGVRVGNETRLASADGIARPGNGTNCPRATGRWDTRVRLLDTSLVPADQASLAVWVPQTLRAAASNGVRLGDETWLAGADGVALGVGVAEGSWTTRVWEAWVLGRRRST